MICFYEKTFEVPLFVNKKDAKQIQPRKNHTDNRGITQTGGALRPASYVLSSPLCTRMRRRSKGITQTGGLLRP